MNDCESCIHKKVCDLWHEQERQDAGCFFLDDCELFESVRPLTADFPVKYTEICALYHFCVDLGIKCTIERLHDGYAVRFPDGSDFAQHHGTYGGTEGCVEPAIGDSEFDYTAAGLNLAKELVKKHKGKLEADSSMRFMTRC